MHAYHRHIKNKNIHVSEARVFTKSLRSGHWINGLGVQRRVIGALMVRDALSRFGHEGLGFFWLIGEPLLLTLGVMALWATAHLNHGGEVSVVPFALTGYSFVTIWRHIVFKSIRVRSQHALLSYHRQIKTIDILIARGTLEGVGVLAAFFVAYLPLYLLNFCPPIRDPLALIRGFVFVTWFSMSFGMILAAISEISDSAHYFVGPIMYITIPATGIFFMLSWLPPSMQTIMSWSPLVNAIEMLRSGLFPPEIEARYSVSYLVTCCLLLTTVGIWLCHWTEGRVRA